MIPTDTWVLPRPRRDAYVGSFPLHFEQRLWAVLGKPAKVLHPFGGLADADQLVALGLVRRRRGGERGTGYLYVVANEGDRVDERPWAQGDLPEGF